MQTPRHFNRFSDEKYTVGSAWPKSNRREIPGCAVAFREGIPQEVRCGDQATLWPLTLLTASFSGEPKIKLRYDSGHRDQRCQYSAIFRQQNIECPTGSTGAHHLEADSHATQVGA